MISNEAVATQNVRHKRRRDENLYNNNNNN